MEVFLFMLFLLVSVCFSIVIYVNRSQRKYIKTLEPLAENWVALLKQRDEMIKSESWDGYHTPPPTIVPWVSR